jgi:hypothetical protein
MVNAARHAASIRFIQHWVSSHAARVHSISADTVIMEPKNQIESELNSALRNAHFMRKLRSALVKAPGLLPVKLPVQFLTDEMRSHRVPHT